MASKDKMLKILKAGRVNVWNRWRRRFDPKNIDLRSAYLRGADLRGADLEGVTLRGADLRSAYLRGADLRGADLEGATLRSAYLRGVDLKKADLRGADLEGADLQGADLQGADLQDTNYDYSTSGLNSVCPEEGSFICWGKKSNYLVKMKVPVDARRSSATARKCRAEFVEVLQILHVNGESFENVNKIEHIKYYNNNHIATVYEVGKVTRCDKWCQDRWDECSGGIHFFVTRHEAESWRE